MTPIRHPQPYRVAYSRQREDSPPDTLQVRYASFGEALFGIAAMADTWDALSIHPVPVASGRHALAAGVLHGQEPTA